MSKPSPVSKPIPPAGHVASRDYNDVGNIKMLRTILPFAVDIYTLVQCDEDLIEIRAHSASVEAQLCYTGIREEARIFIKWDAATQTLCLR